MIETVILMSTIEKYENELARLKRELEESNLRDDGTSTLYEREIHIMRRFLLDLYTLETNNEPLSKIVTVTIDDNMIKKLSRLQENQRIYPER